MLNIASGRGEGRQKRNLSIGYRMTLCSVQIFTYPGKYRENIPEIHGDSLTVLESQTGPSFFFFFLHCKHEAVYVAQILKANSSLLELHLCLILWWDLGKTIHINYLRLDFLICDFRIIRMKRHHIAKEFSMLFGMPKPSVDGSSKNHHLLSLSCPVGSIFKVNM